MVLSTSSLIYAFSHPWSPAPDWLLLRRAPQQRHGTAGAQGIQGLGVLELVVAWKWRKRMGGWL